MYSTEDVEVRPAKAGTESDLSMTSTSTLEGVTVEPLLGTFGLLVCLP